MTSVSIVIPFYNEEENLQVLFNEILDALNQKPNLIDLSIVFVDDCSDDGSKSFIKSKIKNLKQFNLIELPDRSGQTGAFKAAFETCETDFIIRMDSDLQDSPKDLNLFFEKILQEDPDLIMGFRTQRKHGRLLRILSHIYDIVVLTFYNSPLYTNSGSFVAFKTKYVQNLPWFKNDHRYLPLIVIHRGGKNATEVMTRHRIRKYGKSKYPKFNKILFGPFEIIRFIFRLRSNRYDL